MKIVNGDLIKMAKTGNFDVIIHGCNCFCAMGAGITKQIKMEFPEAFDIDKNTKHGDKSKLGNFSYVIVNDIVVINAYTQYHYGGGKNVDYDAIRSVFNKIKNEFSGKRIAYPAIGCGLADGDWNKVSEIIDEELIGEDHTFVIFKNEVYRNAKFN